MPLLSQYPNVGHLQSCLFWFLYCIEFTVPSQTSYNPAAHPSYSDIVGDDFDNPSVVVISIKQYKTDTFSRGTSIALGASHNTFCPVKILMPYLARCGSQAGPHLSQKIIVF